MREINYIEQNKLAYDSLAKEYQKRIEADRIKDDLLLQPFYSEIEKTFSGFIRVLDLGCGNGLNLDMFSKKGFYTVGVDISTEMLKVARQTSPKTILLNENFLETSLCSENFEAIMAKASIHNFKKEDALNALNRVFEILVPNGVFFTATTVSDKSEEGFFRKKDYNTELPRFRKFWTPEELEKAIKSVGFIITKTFYNNEESWNKKWFNIIAKK